MSRTLPAARDAFVAAMKRETSGAELTRLVMVLDALIKWSLARPNAIRFHGTDSASGVLAFQSVETKSILWSARVARGDAPKLEVHVNGRPEMKSRIRDLLNAHSRSASLDKDRLRIGFGALKNAAAFNAVTALLSELSAGHPETAQAPVPTHPSDRGRAGDALSHE